jgi:hypothetical protein
MTGLSKRLEKIERELTPPTGETVELRISWVKPAEDGKPRMRTKGHTLAEMAEFPPDYEYEWFPDDGKDAA